VLSLFTLAGFRFTFAFRGFGVTFRWTVVGDVKTASLEDNGRGMEDPPGGLFAFGAFCLRFIFKTLPHLEMVLAVDAFVFVNGHGTLPRD
jgi:hypothetical protein